MTTTKLYHVEDPVYLYTLPGCVACEAARVLLRQRGITELAEVPIDNPLLEMGVRMLFRDRHLHAPVVWMPDGAGPHILDGTGTRLFRVVLPQDEHDAAEQR